MLTVSNDRADAHPATTPARPSASTDSGAVIGHAC
jgi:hypothetical protein